LAAGGRRGSIDPVKTIPLAEGDLRWVFPGLKDPTKALERLAEADTNMRRLADHLGVTPSWTGSGLEFHCFNGALDAFYPPGPWPLGPQVVLSDVPALFGCAETGEVSFITELESLAAHEGRARPGPPWGVHAQVAVRCDGRSDCGMHVIEEHETGPYDSPLAAAEGLVVATRWLLDRGTTELASSWREREPLSRHD
jgi:hypothetical protein